MPRRGLGKKVACRPYFLAMVLSAMRKVTALSAVCMAAAGALGKIGGPVAVEALIASLHSSHTQVRVASVQALGSLGAAEATGLICRMLNDKEWEVRQEAAAALGKLNNKEALEPLAKALEDADADVRETAAVALGKLRDRRSIVPLVLALKDEVTAVRRIAARLCEPEHRRSCAEADARLADCGGRACGRFRGVVGRRPDLLLR